MPKLSFDGSFDVTEWLASLETCCQTENYSHAELIKILLEGNASRVYRRMMVSEASQREVLSYQCLPL